MMMGVGWLGQAKGERFEGNDFGGLGVFADSITRIELQTGQGLKGTAAGPANLDGTQGGGVAEADFLPQGIAAEAAAAVHGAINEAFALRPFDRDFDARADAATIRLHSHQLQFEPMVSVSGIEVKHVRIDIARYRATHVFMDVLIAVVVEVGEGNAVPFL